MKFFKYMWEEAEKCCTIKIYKESTMQLYVVVVFS